MEEDGIEIVMSPEDEKKMEAGIHVRIYFKQFLLLFLLTQMLKLRIF